MRKLLLILLMCAVGVSALVAQPIRVGAAGNKSNATSIQPAYIPVVSKQMKETKVQMATFSGKALTQEKIISSVQRGDKTMQIVKNSDGTFCKRLVSDKITQKLNRNTTSSFNKSVAAAAKLFESFEGWDEINPDWLPDGWSRVNKAGEETWYISDGGAFFHPTDGDYMASVDWLWPFDDDFNLIELNPRDEMLISPAFIPATNEFVFFDVNYSTYFMFYDLFEDGPYFDDPMFNIQVLVSADNGENWDVIWDANELYSIDDIEDFDNSVWFTEMVSLSDYVGKSIKIAFRYTDRDGGDSIGLDNIAVREPSPEALYVRPKGYFKIGLTQDWGLYPVNMIFGHAYDKTIWRNFSKESETYSWEYENPNGSGTILKTSEKEPNIPYPFDLFEIPELTSSGYGYTSKYKWGNKDMRYLLAGGYPGMFFGDGDPGSCNYDFSLFENIYIYNDGRGGYTFGTNTDNLVEGVANYFEKPVHKYILEGVWAALRVFKGFPASTEFTLVIHRVVDGILKDEIIATSTCKVADVEVLGTYAYTMPFTGFITIDPETGLEVEEDYLEIEDAILIEIKGFNNIPGSEICFAIQEFDVDPAWENNAHLFLANGRLFNYGGSTSLFFNLDVTYSFLLADSDEFDVPVGGGQKSFDVISYFSPGDWWVEEDIPAWIDLNIDFNSTTWDIALKLIAQPLPAGEKYREYNLELFTYGADMSILVKQGSNVGIPVIKVENNKVVNKNNTFELTYTKDCSAVSIYNIAGQKIAGYNLPDAGTFTIPADNYPKGIYIFSFGGANGASAVKAIKQ